MKFLKALPAMAVAIFFAPMVHASTGSVSVKVTDVSFSVQDLAPQDGVTPSFEILDGKWTTGAAYSAPIQGLHLNESKDGYLANISLGDNKGFAKTSFEGLELSNSEAGPNYFYYLNAHLHGSYPGALRLSPNSLLMLSFKLEMTAQADCTGAAYCAAEIGFDVGVQSHGPNIHASYSRALQAFQGSPNARTFSDVVYVPFANSSQNYIDLVVNMNLNASNVSSGVPEPSAVLLVGAGLAICGWQWRTRKLASS